MYAMGINIILHVFWWWQLMLNFIMQLNDNGHNVIMTIDETVDNLRWLLKGIILLLAIIFLQCKV